MLKRSFMSVLSVALFAAGVASADVRVEDKRIFIEVEQQSLTAVFGRVAEVTGAVVQVSPKVERPVSISLRGMPLQRAMDEIARQYGLNIVLGWQRDSAGNSRLTSIDVLPDGDMDYSSLEEDDARQQRVMSQQNKHRSGRAIPGGAEDKSWRVQRRTTDDAASSDH
jgi:hypothetical protein